MRFSEKLQNVMQQGVFPWGYGIKTSEHRWSYFINKRRFEEIEGCVLR